MSEGNQGGRFGEGNGNTSGVNISSGSGKLSGDSGTPRGMLASGNVGPSDIGGADTGKNNGNKEQWFGFWSNVTNSIIAGIFGLLTLVVGAFLSFRGPSAPTTPPATPGVVTSSDGPILETGNPYPVQVRMVALDMKLSDIKALQLPDGKATESGYSFTLEGGPFGLVLCGFKDARDEDPKIGQIIYFFRDAGTQAVVRRQAISVFGSKKMRSSQLGAVMRWPNVQGCNVEIDNTRYIVTP